MSKRFTDSKKWDDEWFYELDPKYKLMWLYMLDKCDHIGFFKPNIKLASNSIGYKITRENVLLVFKDRITEIDNKWFIPKFVHFQYGKLSQDSAFHRKISKTLEDNRVSTGYRQGVNTPKVEVEVKEEVKDKTIDVAFKAWNERMPWKLKEISGSRLTHLKERLKEKQFVGEFHTILTRILESDFLSGRTPSKDHKNFRADFDWLIKNDNNYIKILEGKYANAREKEVGV